jgi:hypothetical protein
MRALALDRLVLAGLAFGAGYVVGVLAAPDAGQRTRRRLSEGARERAAAVQQQARAATEPLAERARATAHELARRHVPLHEAWDLVDGEALRRDLAGRS